MTDLIFRRVISSILLLSAIASLNLVIIASSTYEAALAMTLSLIIAGSLGLAIAKE
jgi:hypothetical protein